MYDSPDFPGMMLLHKIYGILSSIPRMNNQWKMCPSRHFHLRFKPFLLNLPIRLVPVIIKANLTDCNNLSPLLQCFLSAELLHESQIVICQFPCIGRVHPDGCINKIILLRKIQAVPTPLQAGCNVNHSRNSFLRKLQQKRFPVLIKGRIIIMCMRFKYHHMLLTARFFTVFGHN